MTNINYKKLSEELDEVLSRLQSSDIDVNQAAADFKKGMEITKKLEEYLKTEKNKVETIKKKFDQG